MAIVSIAGPGRCDTRPRLTPLSRVGIVKGVGLSFETLAAKVSRMKELPRDRERSASKRTRFGASFEARRTTEVDYRVDSHTRTLDSSHSRERASVSLDRLSLSLRGSMKSIAVM